MRLNALAILLLISFVGVGALGILAMTSCEGLSFCRHFTAALGGASCPENLGPVDFVNFHLNAFKIFSTAVLCSGILGFILALALLVWSLVVASSATGAAPFLVDFGLGRYFYLFENYFLSPQSQMARWLALHENSPSMI